MDFTLNTYKQLLITLKEQGYHFMTFEQYCTLSSQEREAKAPWVIMRHDVDKAPQNSYATALIEQELGIQASYYFRVVPESNQPECIKAIAELGHEIGYHYEDMAIAQGNTQQAYEHFQQQLKYFRQFYPVRTICMHGAPTSKWDGKDLWKVYDYRDLGLIGEPYLDVDFGQVVYLTDTGRRWDGFHVSVRDKIPVHQERWNEKGWTYHTTEDIIQGVLSHSFPQQVMITTHPQRWTDNLWAWAGEGVSQLLKNVVKRLLIRF